MIILRQILVCVLCSLTMAVQTAIATPLADTLQFRFLLHGQTRRVAVTTEFTADNALKLRWCIGADRHTYSGFYSISAQSIEQGRSLCFRQPELNRTISVPKEETAFFISRQAFSEMKQTGHFRYNGTMFNVVDSVACGAEVGSFHVRDSIEGCEMWVVDNSQLPLIWKMNGNPLEIDWVVDNVATAMNPKRGMLRVAFISDPHVMDVDGCPSHVRPLDEELRSTRLFNENQFAFEAALDDVAKRGIRLVVLPGDLTDNGQQSCQEAVRRTLARYSRQYGMSFFVTTGNHDPARPWIADSVGTAFFPRKDYLYWSTPFASYSPKNYSLSKALQASAVEQRTYVMGNDVKAYDMSYVVEPVEGLWLLAIDAGTFLPTADEKHTCYGNASPGYAQALLHKPYLLPWIKRVAADAKHYGKHLVAFCHYPAYDFTGGALQTMRREWGDKSFQTDRIPADSIAWALADNGLTLHFAGHMHLNRSADVVSPAGNKLHCEQVPSTAMYLPAYKILTFGEDDYEVETVRIDSVRGMETLLPHYMDEYRRAKVSGGQNVWNMNDLYSMADYNMFCDMHLRYLVDLRLAKRDLPACLLAGLRDHNGRQLAHICGMDSLKEPWVWTGRDLLYDFYRLFYGGHSALQEIPATRLQQYSSMFRSLDGVENPSAFGRQLAVFGRVFGGLLQAAEEK